MENWIIVKSKSGKNKEDGCPIGQILCRSKNDIEQAIKDNSIHDPVLKKYLEVFFEEK